ncbi:MAG: hypothetical protein RJA70_3838 [Pseudomonadota bacterium]
MNPGEGEPGWMAAARRPSQPRSPMEQGPERTWFARGTYLAYQAAQATVRRLRVPGPELIAVGVGRSQLSRDARQGLERNVRDLLGRMRSLAVANGVLVDAEAQRGRRERIRSNEHRPAAVRTVHSR